MSSEPAGSDGAAAPAGPDDDTTAIRGDYGERVAPGHGDPQRSRTHAHQVEGTHGPRADDQGMVGTEVHHSSNEAPEDPACVDADRGKR